MAKITLSEVRKTGDWMVTRPIAAIIVLLLGIGGYCAYQNLSLQRTITHKDKYIENLSSTLDSCRGNKEELLNNLIEDYKAKLAQYDKALKAIDTTVKESKIVVKNVKKKI